MGSRRRVFLAGLVAVVVAAGAVSAGGSVGAAAKPRSGGALSLVFNAEPAGLDPVQMRGAPDISSVMAAVGIYDELVWTDPATLKVKPKIATELNTTDSGLTWTLKLRSGVQFSDGTP